MPGKFFPSVQTLTLCPNVLLESHKRPYDGSDGPNPRGSRIPKYDIQCFWCLRRGLIEESYGHLERECPQKRTVEIFDAQMAVYTVARNNGDKNVASMQEKIDERDMEIRELNQDNRQMKQDLREAKMEVKDLKGQLKDLKEELRTLKGEDQAEKDKSPAVEPVPAVDMVN